MSLPSTCADPLAHIGRCLDPTDVVFTTPLPRFGKCPADVTVKIRNTVSRHSILFSSNTQNLSKRRPMLEESVQQEWLSYPEAERYSGLSHTTLWRYVT